MAKLERVREIWAHRFKSGDHNELLHLMADLVLETSDPLKTAERAQAANSVKNAKGVQADSSVKRAERAQKDESLAPGQVSTRHSRYIVVAEQNFVQKRDRGACAFVSADGKRCGSRRGIQFDHYPVPFAMGGKSTRDNLRLVCRAHNALGAIHAYGTAHMAQYLPGLG